MSGSWPFDDGLICADAALQLSVALLVCRAVRDRSFLPLPPPACSSLLALHFQAFLILLWDASASSVRQLPALS